MMHFANRTTLAFACVAILATLSMGASYVSYLAISLQPGDQISVHIDGTTLSSSSSNPGDTFQIVAAEPFLAQGNVAVISGAVGQGHVVSIAPAKNGKPLQRSPARIELRPLLDQTSGNARDAGSRSPVKEVTMTQQRVGRRALAMARIITAATLFCWIGLVPLLAASGPGHKPSYRVLYEFTGGADGKWPRAGLIQDQQGNLYGTTWYGGSFDFGTVFKLEPSGKLTVLHSFDGVDGMWPIAALVQDAAGSLYGTTTNGGTPERGGCLHGCGTVFKIDASGKYSVLYAFTGGADGGQPQATVILDGEGNLYGTTPGGGTSGYCDEYNGCGVVFKLDQHGQESVLYTFTGKTDGATPSGGLVSDSVGSVYGVTEAACPSA